MPSTDNNPAPRSNESEDLRKIRSNAISRVTGMVGVILFFLGVAALGTGFAILKESTRSESVGEMSMPLIITGVLAMLIGLLLD